jgi:hypothetical protein
VHAPCSADPDAKLKCQTGNAGCVNSKVCVITRGDAAATRACTALLSLIVWCAKAQCVSVGYTRSSCLYVTGPLTSLLPHQSHTYASTVAHAKLQDHDTTHMLSCHQSTHQVVRHPRVLLHPTDACCSNSSSTTCTPPAHHSHISLKFFHRRTSDPLRSSCQGQTLREAHMQQSEEAGVTAHSPHTSDRHTHQSPTEQRQHFTRAMDTHTCVQLPTRDPLQRRHGSNRPELSSTHMQCCHRGMQPCLIQPRVRQSISNTAAAAAAAQATCSHIPTGCMCAAHPVVQPGNCHTPACVTSTHLITS